MSTTNLFVELIVIGVGASTWVVLLILAAFGDAWVPDGYTPSLGALIPIVSVVYLLGIITDRFADTLFEKLWGNGYRATYFPDRRVYHDTRRLMARESPEAFALVEYGRSRLRICRGWAFNAPWIGVAAILFVFLRVGPWRKVSPLALAVGLGAAVLGVASWCAWRQLLCTMYVKVREDADFLARHTAGTVAPAGPAGGPRPGQEPS